MFTGKDQFLKNNYIRQIKAPRKIETEGIFTYFKKYFSVTCDILLALIIRLIRLSRKGNS